MEKFCSNCGTKRENLEGKFCKNCGHAFGKQSVPIASSQQKKEQSSVQPIKEIKSSKKIKKGQIANQAINENDSDKGNKKDNLAKEKITDGMENAKKKTKQIQETIKQSDWKNKATDKLNGLNRNSEQKKNLIRIGSIVLVIVILAFGWRWVSTKDYRHAMANGDNYFKQGQYDKAMEFYQQAQEEKPGNETAIEMTNYSKELGGYWIQINADEFIDSRTSVIEAAEQRLDQIKDKKIREKYTEVIDTIKNSDQYKLEERIDEKYKKAYGY